MRSLIALLVAISLSTYFVAAEGVAGKGFRFLTNRLATKRDPTIAARQLNIRAKKASKYNNVLGVALDGAGKARRDNTVATGSVPIVARLVVTPVSSSGALGQPLGYVAPSTTNPGAYTYDVIGNAVKVAITTGTTSPQQLLIVGSSPQYPYLAGMSGYTNTGYNSIPYIPSTDFSTGNNNYAFLTNAPAVAYGTAKFSVNAINDTPFVQTMMFGFAGAASLELVPQWYNSNGPLPNQMWGLDSSNNLYMTANVAGTEQTFGLTANPDGSYTGAQQVVITAVPV